MGTPIADATTVEYTYDGAETDGTPWSYHSDKVTISDFEPNEVFD